MNVDPGPLLAFTDFRSLFAAANSRHAIAPIDFGLPPYTPSPGNIARGPNDLPAVCDADWERATQHLDKGFIAQRLRAGVTPLREKYQHGPADELESMAVDSGSAPS